MDWLIGILLLVVGGIIGYFVAKFVNERDLLTEKDNQKELTLQEIMIQQANSHIQESKLLVQQLMAQGESLKQQTESYEQFITNLQTAENGPSLSFFGEHAAAYLRHSSTKPLRENAAPEFQPLDFASQGSGLFSGEDDKKLKQVK